MTRQLRFCWMSMVICSAAATVSPAEGRDKKLTITDIHKVDQNYALQGEYLGEALTENDPDCWRTVGLQVVVRGGGTFDAVKYPGGLPGNGWNGREKLMLNGERIGSMLVLAGGAVQITVHSGYATLFDSTGRVAGQLRKVHRISPTLGVMPPCGAHVVFDGTNTDHFTNGTMTENHWLQVGTQIKKVYRDYSLHLEFRLPYMPNARGQARANSGVYLQSRYEVQILDSFGLDGKDNECGGLYKYRRPDLNMCFPPLRWQTYDIKFRSPRFDQTGKKIRDARLTVWHNGVVIHDDVEVERKTGSGSQESPQLLPIKLQDHGNPVQFRNIWMIDHSERPPYRHPPIQPPPVAYNGSLGPAAGQNGVW